MYKVFAFLKRNPKLTHDEYRAGHVGYHCGQSRRLKNIRGYLVNVWANLPFAEQLAVMDQQRQVALLPDLIFNEPAGFTDWWDGFPQVYFDDHASWLDARTVEPTRATTAGLVVDPDWSLADSPHLFKPSPIDPNKFCAFHLRMHEQVVVPVRRPERKMTKLIQFFQKQPALSEPEFQQRLTEEYYPLAGSMPGLHGYSGNLRDLDEEAAMRDFFAADDWVFSTDGTAERRAFCAMWRGANELFFENMADFAAARSEQRLRAPLVALERELFSAVWYVEVDENLIVLPNRAARPEFYFR